MITEPAAGRRYESAFECSLATKYDYDVLATSTSTRQTTTPGILLDQRVEIVARSTSRCAADHHDVVRGARFIYFREKRERPIGVARD